MRPLILLACLTASAQVAQAQRRAEPLFHPASFSVVIVTIPATEPLSRLLATDCDTDRTRGREAAGVNHSGTGWLAGGFVSGVLLGLIGTAVTWAMANSSTAQPDRLPDGVEPSCYREGYPARGKGINSSSALTGGLLGTALFLVLVYSATSSSGY